MSNQDQNDPQL